MTAAVSRPRWVGARSAVFAVVSALLALAGHLSAVPGPVHLDLGPVAGGAGAVGLAVAGLCRRPRPFGAVLTVLLAGQVAFHVLFALDGHPLTGGAVSGGPAMLGAHAAMALLAAAALYGGDRATTGLAGLARRIRVLLLGYRAHPGRTGRPALPGLVQPYRRDRCGSLSARGPPLPAAA